MSATSRSSIRLRSLLAGCVFIALLGVIGTRAAYLQVVCGPRWAAMVADQYQTKRIAKGKRGAIRDARGRELAVSHEVPSLAAYPRSIQAPDAAARLARALHMDAAEGKRLKARLASGRHFVWVRRHLAPDEARRVRDLEVQGVAFLREYRRFYPQKTLAAQVLGFTDIDGKGIEGLELQYDNDLKMTSARFRAFKDALGRRFGADSAARSRIGGRNLVLTLDATVQFITETALARAVARHEASTGMAVVMEPATGAVLAMANYPGFNPNAFGRFGPGLRRNRTVTDRFEPGSTMKIFSLAAALEAGAYTPRSIFFCENGAYRIGDHTIHDTKPHGWLSLQHILMVSSNIGAVKIGEGIGSAVLHEGLSAFGFGRRTGVDFPGETSGTLSTHRGWTRIDAGTIAFGQGVAVSALQMTAAMAAIANQGVLMQPRLVQAIEDDAGRVIASYPPHPLRRVVSRDNARRMKVMLQTVVSPKGTGRRAALEGYRAGGKTGTAQKLDENGQYARDRFIASFLGFAPGHGPRLAILVVVDDPRKQHYGGMVAAPVFREIAHKTLDYLNVPPDREPGDLLLARRDEVAG